MHAPRKHNQRITAVLAAAGAMALLTGAMVLGAAGQEAMAPDADSAQHQVIEAPARLKASSALLHTAEDEGQAVINVTLDDGPTSPQS
ncbi:hypothetical protein [Streptomyces sp. NBC_00503]|uniref:hypothetical protein n=1 Tax=Streptomyces sp. NBC_00503 TaxID=2903659 RepID=UPI002E80EE26|nr:hypothetical protein [Streptomyces sp. NBC_00503]WUD81020.1 hypothetical protein OG490_10935 [Streptomyces sp. NBC_00503]